MECVGFKRKSEGDHDVPIDQFSSKRVKLTLGPAAEISVMGESAGLGLPQNMVGHGDDFCSEAVNQAVERFNSDVSRSEIIPSTEEVIESLRKVILWMSAQEDHNSNHIEYLGLVERYALTKQHLAQSQQRKITHYLVRQGSQ